MSSERFKDRSQYSQRRCEAQELLGEPAGGEGSTNNPATAQVDSEDLRLVSPIAGAFWAPKRPVPYDPSLPARLVVYSDEEKQAQRDAYTKELQGLKDIMAQGGTQYTFPPGVYRSREHIYMEKTRNFTLTLADVEIIIEEGGFVSLRENFDLVIRGPLALDADPFRVSQCEVTGTDGERYLELRKMDGYDNPTTEGKFLIFDPQGRSFPTGQVWIEKVTDLGDSKFRMDFDDGNKHVLKIPGLAVAGNYLTMLPGPGNIELSINHNLTMEHIRLYCGGAIGGFEYGVDT